jgi:hypothetical protein
VAQTRRPNKSGTHYTVKSTTNYCSRSENVTHTISQQVTSQSHAHLTIQDYRTNHYNLPQWRPPPYFEVSPRANAQKTVASTVSWCVLYLPLEYFDNVLSVHPANDQWRHSSSPMLRRIAAHIRTYPCPKQRNIIKLVRYIERKSKMHELIIFTSRK